MTKATIHPADVRIDCRGIRSVRETRDGSGGVGTNPAHPQQRRNIGWDHSFVLIHDLHGYLFQTDGPTIVAKPLPGANDVCHGCLRKAPYRGKLRQKGVVVGHDTFHLRLLEHKL